MTTRPIGLISALAEETAIRRGRLNAGAAETHAGVRFQPGGLDGAPVVLVETGIGKVNAALVATVLAERFGVGAFLFTCVAGGLDPSLGVGDVVIVDGRDATALEQAALQHAPANATRIVTTREAQDPAPCHSVPIAGRR